LERLVELVDSLLRWSATDEIPQLRRTDLSKLVRRSVASVEVVEGEGNRLIVDAPDGAMVRAAGVHLRAAVTNLVRNALAFSPPGGKVVVRVEFRGEVVRLSVQDDGPGVTSADSVVIFDPFVRGSMTSGSTRGRGLGLFIARRIVEAHGGRIWSESRRGGTGAIFRIELPSADGPRSRRRVSNRSTTPAVAAGVNSGGTKP
jgi:signal transduction histidine kinase